MVKIARLAPVVLVVVCVACGGGSDNTAGTASRSTTTGPATTAVAPPTEPAAAPGASSEPTNAGGPAPTDTTLPAAVEPGAVAPNGGSAGPQPAAPGAYRYKQSGWVKALGKTTTSPPEGTLVVDTAQADGTQMSHRSTDAQSGTDTVLRFGPDGMFLASTTMRAQGISVACTFSPPMASPPWPPTVGATISGQGDCGQTTATVTGTITDATTYALDGGAVDVFVVKTRVVTTGQVNATIDMTAWFAPSLRLIVHDESTQNGSYMGVAFSGASSSDLLSATPS